MGEISRLSKTLSEETGEQQWRIFYFFTPVAACPRVKPK
jgi:hypothetical protein